MKFLTKPTKIFWITIALFFVLQVAPFYMINLTQIDYGIRSPYQLNPFYFKYRGGMYVGFPASFYEGIERRWIWSSGGGGFLMPTYTTVTTIHFNWKNLAIDIAVMLFTAGLIDYFAKQSRIHLPILKGHIR